MNLFKLFFFFLNYKYFLVALAHEAVDACRMSAIWARVAKNAAIIGNFQRCFCFLDAPQSRLHDIRFQSRLFSTTARRESGGNSGRPASISPRCSKRIRSCEEAQLLEQ